MKSPAAIAVFRWLIRDTFRQARATGLLWLMLGVTGFCILFCLSVSVRGGTTVFAPGENRERLPRSDPSATPGMLQRHGVDVPDGELRLLFGVIRIPFQNYREEQVHFLELLLAGGVADGAGILLILIWTAGFLPTFLEGRLIAIQLAKPTPRFVLLLGKYFGVVVFVFVQAVLFVGGTWMALGLKTGIWDLPYLLAIPLLVLQFAVFFSFSLLLAVRLRSTIGCVLGSLVFWVLCWGGNYGRNLIALEAGLDKRTGIQQRATIIGSAIGKAGGLQNLWQAGWLADTMLEAQQNKEVSRPVRWATEGLYWVLPKPADLSMMVFDALRAEGYVGRVMNAPALARAGAYYPEWSVLTSLLFAAVMLVLSARKFARTDY